MTDAIINGLNEAFDIDDMNNVIDDVPVTKQQVRKHSKIYDDVVRFVNENDDKTIYGKIKDYKNKCITDEDAHVKFIKHIKMDWDVLDDETIAFIEESGMIKWLDFFDACKDVFIMIESLMFGNRLTDVNKIYKKYLAGIKSKDDPFYACYYPNDSKMKRIIDNMMP